MRLLNISSCLLFFLFFMADISKAEQKSMLTLSSGNRDFAVNLYKKLAAGDEGNLFLSPHSISTAMAMTFAGARGETEKQMIAAMSFPFGQESLHPAFGALAVSLNSQPTGGVELLTANSLWPHQDFVFLESFLEIVRRDYQSDVFPVDFSDAEPARLQINGWVESKTRDKIKNLIQPGVLNVMTRMVLVNAVYFKGTWLNTFNETLTADRPFTLANGEQKTTPTMYGKIPSRYAELPGLKLLELPYRGDQCVMTIVLPEKLDGLPAIEAALTGKSFTEWDEALRSQEVLVYLPRFSLTSQFSLNKTLADLGMTDAFDESRANFAGMDGKENNLFISAAIHKAFVDVNEKGTEAAAATAVIMQARAMPRPAPEFRADRPFLFYISDRTTKGILFMGRLSAPPDDGNR